MEPFVGSGAVFFDLLRRGGLGDVPVTLADSNADLIGTATGGAGRAGRGRRRARPGWIGGTHARARRATTTCATGSTPRGAGAARPTAREYSPELAAMLIYLEPHRLQRAVPRERRRRVQRAGGPICPPADLRSRCWCAPSARRFAREGLRLQCAAFDEALAAHECRRLRVPRSSLRPAQHDVRLRRLHGGPLLAVGPGTPVRRGRGTCTARLAHHAEQFVRACNRRAVSPGRTRRPAPGLRLWSVPARRAINSRAAGRGVVTNSF